jgi:hypothetical protein
MKRALSQINEALLAGVVEVQVASMNRVERFADNGGAKRSGVVVGTLAGLAAAAPAAYAAAGCNDRASRSLLNFIQSLANFMIGLGAGIALLMLAVGALMIIAGGTPERVSKGMKMIKNVVIGLAVLGAGAFIKFIITTFVSGAQSGAGTASPSCLTRNGNRL